MFDKVTYPFPQAKLVAAAKMGNCTLPCGFIH